MSLQIAIATLIAGITIGYLWQRAQACSITGYRDFYLIRDTSILKTVLGIFLGAFSGFIIFIKFTGNMADFGQILKSPSLASPLTLAITIIGGLGFGFFSTLSDGCPLKHHVNATKGVGSSILYLIGLYSGFVYFSAIFIRYITILTQI